MIKDGFRAILHHEMDNSKPTSAKMMIALFHQAIWTRFHSFQELVCLRVRLLVHHLR